MNANRILGSISALLATATICVWSSAYGQAVIAKGAPVETILQNSAAPLNLIVGNNAIDLLATFNCKSAKGCVVVMSATLQETNNGGYPNETCSYVDGVPGTPGCTLDWVTLGVTFLSHSHEQTTIGKGSHTVQTMVNASLATQVTGWETDYTVYEIK